jgi:DNA-binding NtrC family response regulator
VHSGNGGHGGQGSGKIGDTTASSDESSEIVGQDRNDHREQLALIILWASAPNADRIGDVFLIGSLGSSDGTWTLGRGEPDATNPDNNNSNEWRLWPIRQRPNHNERRPPLDFQSLSRKQVTVRIDSKEDSALIIENVGRAQLLDANGEPSLGSTMRLKVGDTFGIGKKVVFLCAKRPATLPPARSVSSAHIPTFGEADRASIVGESKVAWELRDSLAFLAARTAHVLLLGPSGSGKELAAQCIHDLSNRKSKRIIARNAATFPETLVEAELFGTAANYPNQGMPERLGMVGEAEGGTLFLDEIGELPATLQTRLLRLIDEPGEYQRLGDARPRRASVRMIAATNRDALALRDDLAARFKLRLSLPGLEKRREDIPLIARHIVKRIAKTDPEIGRRFLEGFSETNAVESEDAIVGGEPRFSPNLISRLASHPYTTHVRELERLLWLSLSTSRGNTLELTQELRNEIDPPTEEEEATPDPAKVPTAEEVKAALERSGGVKDKAWRELGLANRWVLARLLKKYEIQA